MAQNISRAKYLGDWELIPELCIYQANEPPAAGRYSIQYSAERIEIEIWWQDQSQNPFEMKFGGLPDGEKHSYDAPGVTHVQYEHVNENTLDSTAYQGNEVVLYARRVASNDGSVLVVNQTISGENGKATNTQIYRRL